jgi:hypothetical protein
MARTVISPEEGAELNQLYAELPKALAEVMVALRTEPSGHQVTGETLRKLLAADAEYSAIIDRIRKILGE